MRRGFTLKELMAVMTVLGIFFIVCGGFIVSQITSTDTTGLESLALNHAKTNGGDLSTLICSPDPTTIGQISCQYAKPISNGTMTVELNCGQVGCNSQCWID